MDTALNPMENAHSHNDDPQMVTVNFKLEKESLRALRVRSALRDEIGVSALLREIVKNALAQE